MCSGKAVPFPNPPGLPGRGSVPSQPGGVSESEWAIEVLQKAGLRVTGARIGVLKVMASHRGSYLRPEDVARRWIKADSMVSVTMAYRVLARLAEVGLLRRGLTAIRAVVSLIE